MIKLMKSSSGQKGSTLKRAVQVKKSLGDYRITRMSKVKTVCLKYNVDQTVCVV